MSMPKLQKWLTFFSIALVVAGGSYLLSEHLSVRAARQTSIPQFTHQTSSRPRSNQLAMEDVSYMQINDVNLSLAVKDGEYSEGTRQWTLNETHAFFMKGSATPLLYGHAKPAVFGPLEDIHVGSVLKLQTSQGVLTFKYVSDEFVSPDNTGILMRHIPDTLLLMTCDGWFSEQRRILHFKYVPEGK
jgi:LPXTG-site transpeptidase (sortase) family protein